MSDPRLPQRAAQLPPAPAASTSNPASDLPRNSAPYRPPGQLPEVVKNHPDWTPRWVRFRMSNGQPDQTNVSKQLRDGFRPVSYEQRAEALVDPESIMQVHGSGNIEVGDLMLMRRHRAWTKDRIAYQEKKTRDQIQGAKNEIQKAQIPGKNYGTLSDDSTTAFTAPSREQAIGNE